MIDRKLSITRCTDKKGRKTEELVPWNNIKTFVPTKGSLCVCRVFCIISMCESFFLTVCEKVVESVLQKYMFFFNIFLENTEATWTKCIVYTVYYHIPNSTHGKTMAFPLVNYFHCKAQKYQINWLSLQYFVISDTDWLWKTQPSY